MALIDVGWPRSGRKIESVLARLGHSLHAVTAIVLTHAHPDHLGAAERLRRTSEAPVRVHRNEVARARGEAKGASPMTLVPSLLPRLWRPAAFGFVVHASARGFMTPTWVDDLIPFDTDDRLDIPGRPRVIATPGHTGGHTAFMLDDHGILLSGDALATLDVLTRARGPRLMPDVLNSDPEGARRSLHTIERLDAATVLPGHGDPFVGSPAEAVARAREVSGA